MISPRTWITARWFWARPPGVSFGAGGSSSPYEMLRLARAFPDLTASGREP